MPVYSQPSLLAIQNEFGGTNPISLSEYYRGGGLTTTNNTGVPTSGAISLGNFVNTYRTSTQSQLASALAYQPYAEVRNYLMSRSVINQGLEYDTAFNYVSDTGPTNRYSTSVSATLNWPGSFAASFDPMLRTSFLTVIMRNQGDASLTNSLSVNGSGVGMTDLVNQVISYGSLRVSYANIACGYAAMAGLSITGTFGKNSQNVLSSQELFVLPGNWVPRYNNVYLATTSTVNIGTVFANDIAMGFRLGSADGFNDSGAFGGTAAYQGVMRRRSRWYIDNTAFTSVVTTGGNMTFSPSTNGSASAGHALVMACTAV